MMERLRRGPCVAQHFLDLHPTRQAVHAALKKLMAAELVECVGQISFGAEGRLCHVFVAAGTTTKANQLRHDAILSSVELRLAVPMRRGVYAGRRLADGRLAVPSGGIDLEVDTGSMGYDELVEKRYPRYEKSPDWVVWVSCGLWGTRDKKRRDGMCERAERMAHCAWFCTLADVLALGWEAPAVNYYDRELALADLLTIRPGPSAPPKPENAGENRAE